MARAGYDPNEAVRFWRRFADIKGSQKVPEFLSTHPTDKSRIRLINRYLTRAKIDYNTLKVKHGLGATIDLKETKPNHNKKKSKPEPPKPIPGISVETLR
jgi:predicted Zn-dependent protease